MKNKYDIYEFYDSAIRGMQEVEKKSIFPSYFYRSIYDGDNKFYQKEIIESKKFNDMWLRVIESYFPSINKITLNVKSTLKYQSEIIPIEKTKKINKESVFHLMSHSNFIREITEDGVIPKQILSILPEIEYGIYENRFIMTLVNRLRDFIVRRVKLMREQLKASHITHMNLSSAFDLEGSNIEMTVDIKQTDMISQRKVDEHNATVLQRAEKMLKLIVRLSNSQFMKTMKRFKQVSSPIMKTQIILSNPDFKNAYLLWMYLDRNNDLGYDYGVKDINKRFTGIYTKRIHQSLMLMCTTMMANTKSDGAPNLMDEQAKYKERAAKTLLKLPSEIDTEPVAFEITDTGLNEYYLAKNRQILKKQFEELIEEGNNYKVALKKALGQTLSITNGIYESFFEFNAEADVFHRLIKEESDNPENLYKSAYDKYIIACSVREVKEKDFRRAIMLEKKWQKQLKYLHKMRMATMDKTLGEEYSDIIEEIKNRYKERLDVRTTRNLSYKRKFIKNNSLRQEEKIRTERETYREKKKELTEKWNAFLAEERIRIAEQAKIDRENEETNFKQTMEKLRKEHQEKMQKYDVKYKDLYIRIRNRIIKESNEKIERLKIREEKLAEQRRIKNENLIEKRRLYNEKMQKQKQERLARENEEKLERLRIREAQRLQKLKEQIKK